MPCGRQLAMMTMVNYGNVFNRRGSHMDGDYLYDGNAYGNHTFYVVFEKIW